MRFGSILRNLRVDNDVDQTTIAQAIDVKRSTISQYETGRKMPSYGVLCKIADYFQVSTDYLLGRTMLKSGYERLRKSLKDDESLAKTINSLLARKELQEYAKTITGLSPKALGKLSEIQKILVS